MPDIFHHFPINVSSERVFKGIATPKGLETWWTKSSSGKPAILEIFKLFFGDEYDWRAVVSKYIPNKEFELTMTEADADWTHTKIGFSLTDKNGSTQVHFYHTGWKQDNDHYRTSCYCWAMYLRILKRNLEFGEEVPYEDRLDV